MGKKKNKKKERQRLAQQRQRKHETKRNNDTKTCSMTKWQNYENRAFDDADVTCKDPVVSSRNSYNPRFNRAFECKLCGLRFVNASDLHRHEHDAGFVAADAQTATALYGTHVAFRDVDKHPDIQIERLLLFWRHSARTDCRRCKCGACIKPEGNSKNAKAICERKKRNALYDTLGAHLLAKNHKPHSQSYVRHKRLHKHLQSHQRHVESLHPCTVCGRIFNRSLNMTRCEDSHLPEENTVGEDHESDSEDDVAMSRWAKSATPVVDRVSR